MIAWDLVRMDGYIPEPLSDKHWRFETLSLKQGTNDVSLREFSSPPQNQRFTNSCVAHAVVKALELKRIQKYGRDAHIDLSILAVYYLARELMLPKQIHADKGTRISLACDVLRRWGVCPETDWPWDIRMIGKSPSWIAMRKAYVHKISAFYRITAEGTQRVENIIQALNNGHPVIFGTAVGKNWYGYRPNEVLSKPDTIIGRHATCLVGYQNGKFLGENSWGAAWGDEGFYLMDEDYIKWAETKDLWVMTAPWEDLK